MGRAARLLFVLLFPIACLEAQAPTDREIAESQRRLEVLQHEREALREEMTRIRSRVSDLSSELENVTEQLDASSSLIAEMEFQIAQREEQVEANSRDLQDARNELAQRKAVLDRRLREIYKRGPLRTWEVLLTADSFSDLLSRYKYLFLIARHDRRVVDEVAQLEDELRVRERVLRASLGQLESVRDERALELETLAALREQQAQALANLQTRERTTADRLERVERDEAQLSATIERLELYRREAELASGSGDGAAEEAAPLIASLTPSRMGQLAWPVEGRLLYEFGRAQRPNGTVVRWNGIGIGSQAGTPVHAVEAGVVVLAGPFEGYGPTVVLSHGGGYYSLYLYLRDIQVTEGQAVRPGEPIGTVGGETTSGGPHIEFQIRAPGGRAVDPIGWLERR
ncbi:MAG: peptidoglycan DD-metalloendopeptidase family protein [Gemmatimonas sp.]|nr:peptidoglycan DD-metalloendopeptidase family protein [Gemmatimonas sp.]